MSSTLIIQPSKFIFEQALKQVQDELDIACEIYIAKNRAIYYTDIMGAQGPGLATKSMLVSWLNDLIRNSEIKRQGIVSLYKKEFPEHFEDGKWQARNMVVYVDFAMKKLTDKRVIKDSNRAKQFANSIRDETWFQQAASVMCVKLVEDLFAHNSLKSDVARSLVEQVIVYRGMVQDMGKIVGHVGKTRELGVDLDDRIFSRLNVGAKRTLVSAMRALSNAEENKIFEKYQPMIQMSLMHILLQNTRGQSLVSGEASNGDKQNALPGLSPEG